MPLSLPLEAGAVRLRRLRESDLDDFLAYRSDPEVARYQGWSPMDREVARECLRALCAPGPWEVGDWQQLGIARAVDDRLVGDIGLLRETPEQLQLGITLSRTVQGRGWASAALRALIGALGPRPLRAISDARNAPSLRLFTALGFAEVGREAVEVKGEPCINVQLLRPADAVLRPRTEVFIACSLDGFIARPDGSLDWLTQAQDGAPPGEDFGYAEFMAGIDALVMGRHTLETVLGFEPWPYEKPVIALSRTPGRELPVALAGRMQWSGEAPAALLDRLGGEGVRRVYLDGGRLIQSFLREDLVDRLTITQVPVLLGQGRPLWGTLPQDLAWQLEGVQHWANGFVQVRHRRLREG